MINLSGLPYEGGSADCEMIRLANFGLDFNQGIFRSLLSIEVEGFASAAQCAKCAEYGLELLFGYVAGYAVMCSDVFHFASPVWLGSVASPLEIDNTQLAQLSQVVFEIFLSVWFQSCIPQHFAIASHLRINCVSVW